MKYILLILLLLFPPSALAWSTVFMGGGGGVSSTATNFTTDANCMGAWLMNGADSSTETDRSGEGVTLINNSSVTSSTTVPGGFGGYSRGFQLVEGDFLFFAESDGNNVDVSGDTGLTIVTRFYTTSVLSDQTLISKHSASAGNYQYLLLYDSSSNEFRCIISGDGSVVTTALSVTGATDATYMTVGCVHDPIGDDITIYIDGVVDTGASNPVSHTSGIFNGTTEFQIGNRSGFTTKYMDGLLDDTAVFNRALSAAEMLEIHNNGIDGSKGIND